MTVALQRWQEGPDGKSGPSLHPLDVAEHSDQLQAGDCRRVQPRLGEASNRLGCVLLPCAGVLIHEMQRLVSHWMAPASDTTTCFIPATVGKSPNSPRGAAQRPGLTGTGTSASLYH